MPNEPRSSSTSLRPHGQPICTLSEEDPSAGHVMIILEIWASKERGQGNATFFTIKKNNSHTSNSVLSKVPLLRWCIVKPHKFGPYYRSFPPAITMVSWESFITHLKTRNSVGKSDVTAQVCLAEAQF